MMRMHKTPMLLMIRNSRGSIQLRFLNRTRAWIHPHSPLQTRIRFHRNHFLHRFRRNRSNRLFRNCW